VSRLEDHCINETVQKILRNKKKALIIGIGGGGDVVSTLPISRRIESLGIKSILGGVAWQWAWSIDPKPGPRSLDDIKNYKKLSDTVALVTSSTVIPGCKSEYPEIIISKLFDKDVVLIDITKGVPGVVSGLREACRILHFDVLIGVDAGGDVLATGKEHGLRSPEADAIMLASMAKLEIPSLLCVVGLGLDGELTLEELKRNIAKCSKYGGYLGSCKLDSEDAQLYEKCLQSGVKSSVGQLILNALKGRFGRFPFPSDKIYNVKVSRSALRILFFDPKVVFNHLNEMSRKIASENDFEEINRIITLYGIKTMYNREKEFIAKIR